MANKIRIHLESPRPIQMDFSDKVSLRYVSPDHSQLENLDYEHSGHTGFMPSKPTLLPELPASAENSRLALGVYDKETNQASKIEFEEFVGRIIKTVSVVPTDAQKGQYLFLQVNEEE